MLQHQQAPAWPSSPFNHVPDPNPFQSPRDSRAFSNLRCHSPQALPPLSHVPPSPPPSAMLVLREPPIYPQGSDRQKSSPFLPRPSYPRPPLGSTLPCIPSGPKAFVRPKQPPFPGSVSYLAPWGPNTPPRSPNALSSVQKPLGGGGVQTPSLTVPMLHPAFKCLRRELRCSFWGLNNPFGAKSIFWKPLTPFLGPKCPALDSNASDWGADRGPKAPGHLSFWGHPPS